MKLIDRFREYLRRHNGLSEQAPAGTVPATPPERISVPVVRDAAGVRAATWGEAPEAYGFRPHGIATPETLDAIRAQAEADARAAQEAATGQWGTWDEPPALAAATVPDLTPPPPMPYAGEVSAAMVHRIAYPDPSDLTPGKDKAYRDMLRRVGVATGTRTSLEDTGVWALPALEPGDGTGVRL